ncbi:hypothetical protein FRB93_000791 [Tulasnella sp. JGI-2019a]|nr:hypothetical protein FRB93_000791 [Tulasnella sp. JGI-2019a]
MTFFAFIGHTLLFAVIGTYATPSSQFTPSASTGLSAGEAAWLSKRKPNVITGLEAYLTNVAMPGLNVSEYIAAITSNQSNVPVIGLTFSGGGNRAELSGLGLYQALDARYQPAVDAKTGGIVQSLTYLSGLSGGSLATTGLAVNGFPTVSTLISSGNLNLSVDQTGFPELAGKAKAGFNLTMADILGVFGVYTISKSIQNSPVDPMSWTWSGIQVQPEFSSGSTPMPIHMAVEAIPLGIPGSYSYTGPNGTILLGTNTSTTVYEYNPFEFGSWTGRVKAFADLQYFGSPLYNASPMNSSICVEGYDSAVFVTGSVVTGINYWVAESTTNGTVGQFAKRDMPSKRWTPYPANEDKLEQIKINEGNAGLVNDLPGFEASLGVTAPNTILYGNVTNPFYGWKSNAITGGAELQKQLVLLDGSETGQENPIWPLIQPVRKLDFIVVSDNCGSELSTGWMNATSFRNTYLSAKLAGVPFPVLPSVNTFLNMNYTSKPVFFGCNEPEVPLVLYVADFPYSAYTNLSAFTNEFSGNQLEMITSNALPLISQDNNQLTANWTPCIACGAILRSMQRMNMKLPEVCDGCFENHCWNGKTNNSAPSFLDPTLVLNSTLGFEEWNSTMFY